MKIDEIAASWDRVKVSLGAAFHLQTSVTSDRENYVNHEISWNPLEIYEIDEIAASWDRVKVL